MKKLILFSMVCCFLFDVNNISYGQSQATDVSERRTTNEEIDRIAKVYQAQQVEKERQDVERRERNNQWHEEMQERLDVRQEAHERAMRTKERIQERRDEARGYNNIDRSNEPTASEREEMEEKAKDLEACAKGAIIGGVAGGVEGLTSGSLETAAKGVVSGVAGGCVAGIVERKLNQSVTKGGSKNCEAINVPTEVKFSGEISY